jgi:endonuclease/exonuclease/phosphatase family metal-dependent hydrolase
VLRTLYQAGFIDVANKLGGHNEPTVPTGDFKGAEFVPFRSDYILATKSLAELVAAYSVIKTPLADMASDHYPIVAEFNV